MARPYSQDLRDRVIEATGNGTSARQAAVRFDVGVSDGDQSGSSVCATAASVRHAGKDAGPAPSSTPIATSCWR